MFTLFKHIKRIHGLSEIYLAFSEDTRCFKSWIIEKLCHWIPVRKGFQNLLTMPKKQTITISSMAWPKKPFHVVKFKTNFIYWTNCNIKAKHQLSTRPAQESTCIQSAASGPLRNGKFLLPVLDITLQICIRTFLLTSKTDDMKIGLW